MRSLLYFFPLVLAASLATSCRLATGQPMGDTVAAAQFEPYDSLSVRTAAAKADTAADTAATRYAGKDSVGIYYIDDASDRYRITLVSYPSKRDTTIYGKTLHIKQFASPHKGNIIRVKFYILDSGDSLVSRMDDYDPNAPYVEDEVKASRSRRRRASKPEPAPAPTPAPAAETPAE